MAPPCVSIQKENKLRVRVQCRPNAEIHTTGVAKILGGFNNPCVGTSSFKLDNGIIPRPVVNNKYVEVRV